MQQEKLAEWLTEQIKRTGWSYREIGDRGGLPHSSVAAVFEDRRVGLRIVSGLARAFGVPVVNLLELAELIPKSPPESRDTRLLTNIYYGLEDTERAELIRYAEYLRDRR